MTPAATTDPLEHALAVIPVTGEIIPADATTTDVVDAVERIVEYLADLAGVRQALIDELARRLDSRGTRTADVGAVKLTANAPTEDRYDVDRLRAALEPLIADGRLEAGILDDLVVTPPPTPPAPRVDRRRLNVLLKSDDRQLLAALAAARERVPTRRTVKIERPR